MVIRLVIKTDDAKLHNYVETSEDRNWDFIENGKHCVIRTLVLWVAFRKR